MHPSQTPGAWPCSPVTRPEGTKFSAASRPLPSVSGPLSPLRSWARSRPTPALPRAQLLSAQVGPPPTGSCAAPGGLQVLPGLGLPPGWVSPRPPGCGLGQPRRTPPKWGQKRNPQSRQRGRPAGRGDRLSGPASCPAPRPGPSAAAGLATLGSRVAHPFVGAAHGVGVAILREGPALPRAN